MLSAFVWADLRLRCGIHRPGWPFGPRQLIRGERHLDRVLREFVQHYNCERPHRGIDLDTPVPYLTMGRFANLDSVERTDRLGGLLHEYRHAA
jgi:transposase InsO family protein